MAFWSWSRTAASNATADGAINWAEGQAPSSVNDSARAMMARLAEYRDDTSGVSMGTAGTSTAYTVSSHQVFDSTAHMGGMEISISPHVTNGASPTLNVDGLGAFPITSDGTTAIPAGTIIAGSFYSMIFAATSWILKDFYGNPYNIPIAGMMDFIGSSVPNSSFVFPIGQAISRATYATLFGLISTTYGVGDGSTTFNVPDLTGRVVAMKEASATRLTSTHFGGNSTVLGAVGGLESNTLTTTTMPAHSHVNTLTDPGHFHDISGTQVSFGSAGTLGIRIDTYTPGNAVTISKTTGVTINNASAGTGSAHANVQPTIICNKILRII